MGRKAGYKKTDYSYRLDPYIQGNTVRKIEPMPMPYEEQQPAVSDKTRRNREKALQMNFGYVLFLTGAAVLSLFVCVNFLKLQSENMENRKVLTELEKDLKNLKIANNTAYEKTLHSVDLESIKEMAIHELGMVYAGEGQVITYESQENDYVRQYENVPTK